MFKFGGFKHIYKKSYIKNRVNLKRDNKPPKDFNKDSKEDFIENLIVIKLPQKQASDMKKDTTCPVTRQKGDHLEHPQILFDYDEVREVVVTQSITHAKHLKNDGGKGVVLNQYYRDESGEYIEVDTKVLYNEEACKDIKGESSYIMDTKVETPVNLDEYKSMKSNTFC